MHGADTGDNGSKGADHGHEPGDDDGFGAVFIVKSLSFENIVFMEKQRVFAGEDFFADFVTEHIANTVAGDSGYKSENQ